jgi:hypothetical protein
LKKEKFLGKENEDLNKEGIDNIRDNFEIRLKNARKNINKSNINYTKNKENELLYKVNENQINIDDDDDNYYNSQNNFFEEKNYFNDLSKNKETKLFHIKNNSNNFNKNLNRENIKNEISKNNSIKDLNNKSYGSNLNNSNNFIDQINEYGKLISENNLNLNNSGLKKDLYKNNKKNFIKHVPSKSKSKEKNKLTNYSPKKSDLELINSKFSSNETKNDKCNRRNMADELFEPNYNNFLQIKKIKFENRENLIDENSVTRSRSLKSSYEFNNKQKSTPEKKITNKLKSKSSSKEKIIPFNKNIHRNYSSNNKTKEKNIQIKNNEIDLILNSQEVNLKETNDKKNSNFSSPNLKLIKRNKLRINNTIVDEKFIIC